MDCICLASVSADLTMRVTDMRNPGSSKGWLGRRKAVSYDCCSALLRRSVAEVAFAILALVAVVEMVVRLPIAAAAWIAISASCMAGGDPSKCLWELGVGPMLCACTVAFLFSALFQNPCIDELDFDSCVKIV